MIPDEDVRLLFQNKLAKQAHYGGDPVSLQIFRGKSALLWKGQHPAGCFRHFTVFNKFGVIPEYCFDCCKVVIEPRTVVELFKLLMVFERLQLPDDNTRKCMCETRDFCPGTYKGLIYCKGVEEAKQVYEIVRLAVSDDISAATPVTLKRGCSEFERAHPGYARIEPGAVMMEYKKEWKAHEDFVDKHAVFASTNVGANSNTPYNPVEIFATHFWLGYAATIGDMSYLTVTGRTVPPVPQLKRPPYR
ncbi:MAG: hypothetical protein AB1560_02300 [Pseudomonadota bacterium]